MPITFRLAGEPAPSGERGAGVAALTFDGTSRVVLGRGAGSDVRLPDPSVSHRHAIVQVERSDFTLIDEGSSNGTFVGEVRLPRGAPRVLRNGDRIRLGRVYLDVTLDVMPPTRDVAGATRELALALVAGAMAQRGDDRTPRVVVVEGKDRGAELLLHDTERAYVVGRGPDSALPLSDTDASREHVAVYRRDGGGAMLGTVYLRDLGSKNGAYLGDEPLPRDRDVVWKPQLALALGQTVLALDEPLAATLARLEAAADEAMPEGEIPPEPPPPASAGGIAGQPATTDPDGPLSVGALEGNAPIAAMPPSVLAPTLARPKKKSGWSPVDVAVVIAALVVLVLSIAGMTWLLR